MDPDHPPEPSQEEIAAARDAADNVVPFTGEIKEPPAQKADLRSKGTQIQQERIFPQSPDAERGVLSSILLTPNVVIDLCVEKGITPDTFYIPAHQEIYRALLDIHSQNKAVDFITLAQYLRDRQKLEQVGGGPYLNDLFVYLPTAANVNFYADILSEKAILRGGIDVCSKYLKLFYEEQDDPNALVAALETAALQIQGSRFGKAETRSQKDLVMQAIGLVQEIYEKRGKISGIETGFRCLDELTNGLQREELWIIAARPSYGKTAIALNIVEHVACNLGIPCIVFSLEMSALQLTVRLLCSMARVNLASIRNGFLSERDFPAITKAAAKLAAAPVFIDDVAEPTIQYICAKARRISQQLRAKGTDNLLIVTDYAQMISSENSGRRNRSREEELSEISRSAKKITKDLKCSHILVAQLNRNKSRESRRARLEDLRGSGSFEQDADTILFLEREEMELEHDDEKLEKVKGKAELIIGKQRNGERNVAVPLTFLKEFTRFEDRATDPEPDVDAQGNLL